MQETKDSFANRVYEVVKLIPRGRVTTYKEVGKALNCRGYRAIGQALRRNPFAPLVPCHRVVKSDGRVGGFMGKNSGEEIRKKVTLLKREGVEFTGGRVKSKYLWQK